VIHGSSVDAVLVVAIAAAMSVLLLSMLIRRTTATAASAAPSGAGGTIRSYVHNSLFWAVLRFRWEGGLLVAVLLWVPY
jgi:H+/gluconate symporter-like permease